MIPAQAITWKEHKMDYLTDRTISLIKKADELELNDKQKEFVHELFLVIEDMAVITDDLTDAVDELDMRLLEIEQIYNNQEDKPE